MEIMSNSILGFGFVSGKLSLKYIYVAIHLQTRTGGLPESSLAMAMQSSLSKPLASWKTWWSPELPRNIAQSILDNIDVRKLPRDGLLLTKDSFRSEDLKDCHTAAVVEGLLLAYPKERHPSAYLLGDAVLELNTLMNQSLLGPQHANPVKENSRRDDALGEGAKLKKLLSFVRNSSLKHDVGKTATATYLKQLANSRVVRGKDRSVSSSTIGSSDSQPSPSSASDSQSLHLRVINISVVFPNTSQSQKNICLSSLFPKYPKALKIQRGLANRIFQPACQRSSGKSLLAPCKRRRIWTLISSTKP